MKKIKMIIMKKRIILYVLFILILIIIIASQHKIFIHSSSVTKEVIINNIARNGIESSELKIKYYGNEIMVYTKLTNNSDEVLNGYYIEIELLDEDDNHVTTLKHNSNDIINIHQTVEFISGASLPNDAKTISKARIIKLVK